MKIQSPTTEPLWQTNLSDLNDLPAEEQQVISARLSQQGSMTRHLTEHFQAPPTVQLLNQHWKIPQSSEAKTLNIPAETPVWTREVILCGDQGIYMYARSLFPPQTLAGDQGASLVELDTKPLGSVLFADPHLQRTPFRYAKLYPDHDEWQTTIKALPSQALCPDDLWARRSVFHWFKRPILLTEVFLPLLLKSS